MRCGIDIVQVDRIKDNIAKYGQRFLQRIYTAEEIEIAAGSIESLAGRFAAKEAVAKALGTGLWRNGVNFTEVEILQKDSGEPDLKLHGSALKIYHKMNVVDYSISISHEHEYAVAVCFFQIS